MIISRNSLISAWPFPAGVLAWILVESAVLSGAMLFVAQLLLFFSVVLVIWQGSNWLVNSSQDIAKLFQVSPFLIGLTVVAFGTSIPEMVTSLLAGFGGKGDIAIGNVVGSNILNISVILGGLALLMREGLATEGLAIRLEAPVLILGTLLLLLFIGTAPAQSQAIDGLKHLGFLNQQLDRIEAGVLAAGFVLYLFIILRRKKTPKECSAPVMSGIDQLSQQPTRVRKVKRENQKTLSHAIAGVVAGIAVVISGCHVLVGEAKLVDGVTTGYGAVWFASVLNVPDYLVGMTIVALGTSAPEIVVSLSAARSGSVEIGVGNLLGSATFNLFAVLGLAGLLVQPPLAKPMTIHVDALPSLMAMGLLFIMVCIFMVTRRRLSRKEGLMLLCTGVAYMIYDVVHNMARQNL